jgi:hypothetical protein
MDSQPLDDFQIIKVHSKTWVSNITKALRNKVKITSTLSFVDSTGEEQTFTVAPSIELCKEYQPCVNVDDDEHIMQLNEFNSKLKVCTQDHIDLRIAKSTQHQVSTSQAMYSRVRRQPFAAQRGCSPSTE